MDGRGERRLPARPLWSKWSAARCRCRASRRGLLSLAGRHRRRQTRPPFHVTHVDAHADLGQGDAGLIYLLTELLFAPPEGRRDPPKRYGGLTDGNYLSFAVACRWLSGLVFVFSEGRLEDIPPLAMEGFDARASHIELAAVTEGEMFRHAGRMQHARVEHFEPRVPFALVPRADFHVEHAFDFVFLARSPNYTSTEADAVFDQIRSQFIDESAF